MAGLGEGHSSETLGPPGYPSFFQAPVGLPVSFVHHILALQLLREAATMFPWFLVSLDSETDRAGCLVAPEAT